MNKTELIAAVAEQANLTKKDAEAAVNAVVATITETVAKDEKVQIVGFGTFERRTRAAREARNPRKPEETIEIPATNVPAFKAGKAFKDAVK